MQKGRAAIVPAKSPITGGHTPRTLLILLLAYGAASLVHYVHNAEFLLQYPNMPAWLSPAQVYAAWIGVTLVGVVGYLLVRRGYQLAGLLVIAAYAALGFDGLGHYGLAPLSAHTVTMNLTIWLEVAAASLLLVAVAGFLAKQMRQRHSGS
jgi:hypothetical protein